MRVELVDLLLGGDAAGGRDAPRRGRANGEDRVDVRAAHQPFGVDVGVEELAAVRLERADGLDGGERQRGLPAVNHDVAAAAVDGGDDALGADRVGERLGELEIGACRP